MRDALRTTVAALLLTGLPAHAQQAAAPVPSVVVAPIVKKDVTPGVTFVGRVEARARVELRARVSGILEAREFREGHDVTKGARLFVIEKAPYEVVVEERRADLAGAEATLRNAQADLERKKGLLARQAVAQADLDSAQATQATAEAGVLIARAALKRAELDLGYTEILAPMDGQISRARIDTGNLVGPDSDSLATVTSIDPIHVTLPISDRDLVQARRNGFKLGEPTVFPTLFLSDGTAYEHPGEFNYLDTEVNQGTDTVLARAEFPNPDRLLVPGQFVRVAVRRKETVEALVVPQVAVQEDQTGPFVLVVGATSKVEMRRIRIGNQLETEWEVKDGLAEGERVITQGIQKVRPDMTVNAVTAQ